jgi:hypothetical protein
MTFSFPPLPSVFGTEVFSWAVGIARLKPAADPFFAGMSGVTTLDATNAGRILAASLPEVVPSLRPSCPPPPQAASSGDPTATAAVAAAVEVRKLLRLGPEEEAAFGVIASTLRGAPGHPAGGRRLWCLRWNWPIGSGRPAEGARHQAASLSKRFDVAARLSEHPVAYKARFDNSFDGCAITREERQVS